MKVEIKGIKISQQKYVAIKPDGSICGPIGDSKEFVKEALIIGYRRTMIDKGLIRHHHTLNEVLWKEIVDLGYTIKLASIELIEE